MSTDDLPEGPSAKKNRHRRMAAYVIMALAGAFGLWKVSDLAQSAEGAAKAAEDAANDVDIESRKRAFEICTSSNQDRSVILQLVLVTTSSGGGTNFEAVEGFDALPPELQQYLHNLGSNGDVEEGEESFFLQRARELLAPEDCSAL